MLNKYKIKANVSSSDLYMQSILALADDKLELATPAYRLCALILNQLFQYIIFLPLPTYSSSVLFNDMDEEYDS